MKIYYKKRSLNINLFLGIMMLLIFIMNFYINAQFNWTVYCWLCIALVHFGMYFYQRKYQYINIEDGIISINGPLGKKLTLSDIKRIRKFAGDHILKTDKKELTINTQIIDQKSLSQLNSALNKLDVVWY